MATNTPAKHPDIQRVPVGAALETPFSFDGVPTAIGFHIQTVDDQVDLYISLVSGGTFSPDNFYTLKAGFVMVQRDINWTPDINALYLRSAAGDIIVEVWYWG